MSKEKVTPIDGDSKWSARESWRTFGIMSEFVEATECFNGIQPAVSIFGSARIAPNHPYYQLAEDIARRLSDAGFSVLSGGGPGIMEAVNRGALAGRSLSVGLNIRLPHEQHANPYQDLSYLFEHFFARKVMFVKFATAYVVLPGGYGTLDELLEALTLVQTRKIRKMPVILVHAPFWNGLLDWLKTTLVDEGMIHAEDLDLVQVIDDPQKIVDTIFEYYEKRGFELTDTEREMLLSL